VALDAGIDAIAHDTLMQLWPASAVPKTRDWLIKNLSEGTAKHVAAGLRLRPQETLQAAVSFDFEDVKVRYLKGLPPVEGATGYASISDNAFHLSLTRGRISAPKGGALDAAGSSMVIADLASKPAVGAFDVQLDGPLRAALHVMDLEPLAFLSKSDISPDVATGRAKVQTALRVPLKQKVLLSDVGYEVRAQVRDVASDTLVAGRALRSPRMDVAAGDGRLSIAGKGTLDAIPMDVVWSRAIGENSNPASKVEGSIELSTRTLDAFNVGLPKGSVSGRGTAQIDIDLLRGQPPEMALRSDLRGIGLSIPAVGWSKPRNASGDLRVGLTLGPSPKVRGVSLKTAGLEAQGDVILRPGGGLERATFTPLRVAGRLNSRVDVIGRGNGPAQIKITGGTIDIRQFGVAAGGGGSGSGGGGGGNSAPLELALDRLVVTDTVNLDNFKGKFRGGRGLDGTFTASLNGSAPISGTVVPTPRGPAVRIRSDNGGRVIAASGIFRNAKGGDMSLVLQPNGKPGQFDGQLTITNARVKNAPALADLLTR